MNRSLRLPEEDAGRLIAAVAARTGYDDLSADEVDVVKRAVLDTVGVSIAATGLARHDIAPGQSLCATIAVEGGGGVPAIGQGWRLQPLDAVFWLGLLTHAVDYDDYADTVHPSGPVVCATLPIAQGYGPVDGRSFIAAVAVGQDLVIRIALALRRSMADYGWLPAMPGVMGSALATAKMLGASADGIGDALGLALHQTAGTMQAITEPGSGYRGVREAFNARAGALSALLAERGLPGDVASLEGRYGLFQQFFDGDYDRERLLDGLGDSLTNTHIILKPWPCAGHTHRYVTALEELLADPSVRAEDVRGIRLSGSSMFLRAACEPRAERVRPRRAIDAKASLPFIIGTYLLKRRLLLDDFGDEALRDPRTHAAAELVSWREDPSLKRAGEGFGPGVVELELVDGRVLRAQNEFPRGHPRHPLSWEQLVEKFEDCVASSALPIPADRVRRFVDAVAGLETVDDVGEIAGLLHVPR